MSNIGISPGRSLMTASNLFYSCGAFIADWSVTHVLNPRWPPHARFHNGQTMSLGALLATLSIYLTHRKPKDPKDSLRTAAIVGSLYCVAGLSAIWYPGTLWIDPEFGEGAPQLWIFGGSVIAMWVGYWLEIRKMGLGEGKRA